MYDAIEGEQSNGGPPLKKKERTSIRGLMLARACPGAESDDPRYVSLQARTLLQFAWLEFFAAADAKTQFYRCANTKCRKFGLVREPGRPGPDRENCSEACRKKAGRARAA
jgi:hypothetical protein